MKESFSIEVKRGPQEVFDSLTDLERLAKLSGGKLTIKPMPDRARQGKGAAVQLLPQVPGHPTDPIVCETLEWDPPRLCVRRFLIQDLPTTATLRFSPQPGGTKVDVELDIQPQSMLYKMALPVLAMKFRSEREQFLAKLQDELKRADRRLPPGTA